MTKKADRDQVRRQNRSVILQTLRREGALARIELGEKTHLSPATVTAITFDLIEEGLLRDRASDDGKPAIGRGRPRTLLALDPQAADILGVKISLGKIELILTDFSGRRVSTETCAIDTQAATRTSIAKDLIAAISGFLTQHDIAHGRIAEIVVASQGVVDTRSGSIIWSPAFSVRDIPLLEPLSQAFGVKCSLSNDANMIAEALHDSNPEHYSGTFAVVFIDYGVGMGMFFDNKVFTGETGAAAELGHTNHVPGGPLCRCGKRGCLEAFLSDYALARAARGLPDAHDPWTIEVGANEIADLVTQADAGDEVARKILHDAGRALGYGIARLVAIIDPGHIALTGAGMRAFKHMREAMQSGLEEALVADLRRNVTIDPHPWDEDLIAAGMVAGALKRLDRTTFASPPRRADAATPADTKLKVSA